ncbi:MAG: ShlB/FhaC/HecB family hemolysin secretion/activation protein [Methylococcales bacterium]|nr:ShlB/FhaC/HecB family hemolysin secretion/activation protein [Methylococcales bacterium]
MTRGPNRYLLTGLLLVANALTHATEDTPRFNVLDIQIWGNTVLDDEALETAVYPYLGLDKTLEDVEQARQSLEKAYHEAGYASVLVEIPAQDIDDETGAVRFNVVEGQIESLTITGSRYYDLDKIRERLPALAEGEVPNMPKVQEQINTLAQESADRNITPIMRAGSTPGKMEVELRVKDELPLHGSLEMNSRNAEMTSYSRLVATLRYDNLWQEFHSASLQYQVSPEKSDEVEVWSGTYVLPTHWWDTRLALYGVGISSNTELGVAIGGATVVGTGTIFGARLVKPIAISDWIQHSLTAGFDYKSFDQAVALTPEQQTEDSVSYASFMLGYDATWRGDQFVDSANLAVHFSVRGLGNDADEFAAKRVGAKPDFIYLTGGLKHQHQLPLDFRLLAQAQGQVSAQPLISNEQFSAGGVQSVRGYHQTQLLGDHGINLSLEIQSPRLLSAEWQDWQNFRLLGFFDWAGLWTRQAIAPTPAFADLASAGLGLRFSAFRHLTGEFDWAYPLMKQGTVDVGQNRVDFRLVYDF